MEPEEPRNEDAAPPPNDSPPAAESSDASAPENGATAETGATANANMAAETTGTAETGATADTNEETSGARRTVGIILILVGLWFFLDQLFGLWAWAELWPVLLIVIGIILLVRR